MSDVAEHDEHPALTGIARMAAESAQLEERNDVDYRELDCKSALNRVNGTRAFFDWSLNPYRGCEFGCVYCYARYTHAFMEHQDPTLFERRVYVKRTMPTRLARELAKGWVAQGQTIGLGAATDPYQPAERRNGITRGLMEVMAASHGIRLSITTKSDLITRDIPLLKRIARRGRVRIHITVTTTDPELARKLEPRAPTPRARLAALKKLRDAGLDAGVNLMPVMPGINDRADALEAVASASREANAAYLHWNTLFLTDLPRQVYFAFVQREFPVAWELTRRFYETGGNVPAWYQNRVDAMMGEIAGRHGFANAHREGSETYRIPEAGPPQLELFGTGE